MVRSLVFSAGFLFFFAVPLFLFAQSRPAVGSEAPNFTLKSQDGTPVSLKDFRGKWVVLFFYPQDFGGACTVQVQNFQRDLKEYQQKGAVLLGISINDVESHQRFSTKEGLQYKILSDNDQAVSRLYGTLRNMALVKYAMRVTFVIDSKGRIAKVFDNVNASNHSQELLSTLAELQKEPAANK